MKKVAIALLVAIACFQIGTTVASGLNAVKTIASVNARQVAMMEQAEK